MSMRAAFAANAEGKRLASVKGVGGCCKSSCYDGLLPGAQLLYDHSAGNINRVKVSWKRRGGFAEASL